jgi:ABC-type branched-subunit amino acid transport system ATPase component
MDISDRVYVLNFGRKIAEGTPADQIPQSRTRRCAPKRLPGA